MNPKPLLPWNHRHWRFQRRTVRAAVQRIAVARTPDVQQRPLVERHARVSLQCGLEDTNGARELGNGKSIGLRRVASKDNTRRFGRECIGSFIGVRPSTAKWTTHTSRRDVGSVPQSENLETNQYRRAAASSVELRFRVRTRRQFRSLSASCHIHRQLVLGANHARRKFR